MKQILLTILILLIPIAMEAGEMKLDTPTGDIFGSIEIPTTPGPHPAVLIISGSGPTDRDGNSEGLPGKNNSLKMLAEALAEKGIASLRYDKRGNGESKAAGSTEKDLRFDMYIDDAERWAVKLMEDKRFNSVTILGHSEGSLIGMVAARKSGADAYVSLSGPANTALETIGAQLKKQLPPALLTQAETIIAKLEQGKVINEMPDVLKTVFRPTAQPYLISWNAYDPSEEIKKLDVPIIIVQGSTDIQVSVKDAEMLKAAKPEAQLEIIDGMNHVLKLVPSDRKQQIASYSNPALPISPRFKEVVTKFIIAHKTLKK